jgi:hypothetical protein
VVDFQKIWRKLRIDIEVARTYERALRARNQLATAGRLIWLEQMLPTLLFIRVMEMHDDALEAVLAERNEIVPKRFGGLLKGRLKYIEATWQRPVDARLLTHADRRNDFGHEHTESAQWRELAACIADVQESLFAMGCIPQPITDVKVDYMRVSASPTEIVWRAHIVVTDPQGLHHETWEMSEDIALVPAN